MNTSFATYSIRNPIPAIVLFLVLTVAGLLAFKQLPITNLPDVSFPEVQVSVAQPGAAAAELETQVTRKVEDAMTGVQGVKHILSTINEGSSVTEIEFYIGTNIDRAMNDVRDAVAKIRSELPKGIEEPLVQRTDFDGGALLVYSVVAPNLNAMEISRKIDEEFSRAFTSLKGVAKVERGGGMDEEVTVTLDPAKLAAFGITAGNVSRQLTATNVNLPGGRITFSGNDFTVRTLGSAATVDILRQTEITLGNGRAVKLGDLATLSTQGVEIRNMLTIDGKPTAVMNIYKAKGASEVDVAERVQARMVQLKASNPDIQFREIFNTVTPALESYHGTLTVFLEGALLTVLVVLFFLRDARSTILAAIAIPLSIIPTFLVMYWLGFTLNAVSLLAITLVTGVLVDDAIVEIENIHRHMKEGKSPYQASILAVEEIGLAVIATTLVIVAVFAPVSFMGGIPGQFFKQFGITVAVAALFSLLVARLLTPMMAAYLLKPQPDNHVGADSAPSPLLQHYRRIVEWTLDHRKTTLLLAGLSLVFSFGLIPFISAGFLPKEDLNQSIMRLEMAKGTPVTTTHATAIQLVERLKARPEVRYVMVNATDNTAQLYVRLVDKKTRDLTQDEFESATAPLLASIPDARIAYSSADGDAPVELAFLGNDSAALTAFTNTVEQQMREVPGLVNIVNSAGMQQPEIVIKPDLARAAELGISVQDISDAINSALTGDVTANLAKFNTGTRQIPIRVRLDKAAARDLELLQTLPIPTTNGASVPLAAVAEITFGLGPTTIERMDRQRKISLTANLSNLALGDATNAIMELPAMKAIPAGITEESTGDAAVLEELFTGFALAIVTGLMLVYAVQVLLYKDWLQPFSRMIALPLSVGGAFLLLLLTGTELNLPAIIGILMLMGIADKNSILLVDYMLELLRKGEERRQAIVHACMVRARPIVMTSLAMLAGMMPIALGIGQDTAFRAPMAVAVIGGLISSTALSLIFVPVLFSYVRDFEEWLGPKLAKLVNQDSLREGV